MQSQLVSLLELNKGHYRKKELWLKVMTYRPVAAVNNRASALGNVHKGLEVRDSLRAQAVERQGILGRTGLGPLEADDGIDAELTSAFPVIWVSKLGMSHGNL